LPNAVLEVLQERIDQTQAVHGLLCYQTGRWGIG
jgi:hypothetical protein